jgi:pyrroline-5-carboxylate reductase
MAVKPQSFRAVAHSMGPLSGSQLVISVMAGHGSGSLRAALGGAVRVVRAMPNTAAQVGMAVTALARGEGSVPADMDEARHLFEGVGRTVDIEERLVDAAVATVGSGPAYLFLLAEAEIAAAVRLGIPEREARAMVTGTLLGSATLLDRDGRTPAQLRAAVTSEGGTTAAAMKVFEARGFAQAVDGAMAAACARSAELSS